MTHSCPPPHPGWGLSLYPLPPPAMSLCHPPCMYGVENRDVQHFRLMDPNGAHLKPFPFQQVHVCFRFVFLFGSNVSQLACEHYSEVFQRQIVDIQANFWYGRLIMLNPHYAEVCADADHGGGGGGDDDDGWYYCF